MSYEPPAPQDPYGQPAQPSGGAPSASSPTGFLSALFDFNFERYITPMIVKMVYAIALVFLVLMWLFMLVAGFAAGASSGLVVLLLGPVAIILYLAFIRMTLEFYLSIVRMSQDIHERLPRA